MSISTVAPKSDFPLLQRQVHGKPLVYLDNAATSQKPQAVIDAISEYYTTSNANVHRGVHQLSDESTTLFEQSRQTVSAFFGVEPQQLIVTRNTTEALNGVRYGWAGQHVHKGDVVVASVMEHHSNLVMWQELCAAKEAELRLITVTDDGYLDEAHFEEIVEQAGKRLKLVSLVHISNTLGTVNDVAAFARLARQQNSDVVVAVDGAQAAPHIPLDFNDLNVDFYAVSGHKMLAPMGVGGLLVHKRLLDEASLRPWLFGGGMIAEVYPQESKYHPDVSEKFVAGTPDVASLVGWAAACRYLDGIGMRQVAAHDQQLVEYALQKISQLKGITVVGPTTAEHRVGSVAFIHDSVHAHDVAQVLDSTGVAVRSGHHCTMPLHSHFGWQATVRASFQVYNSSEDIDALCAGLQKVATVFGL